MGADPEEIERLYRERYVSFRNAIATLTGSYESARDVVQEAFTRALVSREQYRGDGSLAGWVWRIALRAALEQRRVPADAPSNGVPEAALPEAERDPELAEALRGLSPRRRLVVFLHYFADLSYVEIAELAGVSEGTVAATLAQAREALRQALEADEASRRRARASRSET